jgi:hypothetical protein
MPSLTELMTNYPEAILEIPAGRSQEFLALINRIRECLPGVEVRPSSKLREPQIYLTNEHRIYEGDDVLRSLYMSPKKP